MKKRVLRTMWVLVPSAVGIAAVAAQAAKGPAGHWEGTLQVPGQELRIEVDLSGVADKWEGTITIPAQNLTGFPLSAITVQGETVTFAMQGVPGDPRFKGTLSKDGKSLSGDFTQGGGTIPFALSRTGDAKIEPVPKSTAITKDIEGSWEGALNVEGKTLRLALKLSNSPDGARGTLISIDQGGGEIPITTIVQTGTSVKLVLRPIAANYDGKFEEGKLTGTWTQGPTSFPLVFARSK